MSDEIKKGLLGIVVDETTVSQVMPDINSLTYRGYAVQDLCEKCTFEEVAYLVLNGELHQIHFEAWKKGLKSLYYCRSKSIQRAENINSGSSTDIEMNVYKNKENQETEYEECLSCQ